MREDSMLTENESSKDESQTNKLKSIKEKIYTRLNTANNARIKRNISIFLGKYSKVAAYGTVILLMVVVCTVSIVDRKSSGDEGLGIVMSMTELASETKAFAGKSFDADILTYDDMLEIEENTEANAISEAESLRLEVILATVQTDGKSQSATLSERQEEDNSSIYQVPTVTSTATVTIDGSTVVSVSSPVSAPVYATADSTYEYLGEYLLTGYCACPICCGAWSNIENPITASGATASANHTIAVDTSVISFGTEILINGQVYVAEDRGSAIIGNHIDIFFSTHEEAQNWGKQYASVYRKIIDGSED